jgi:hypothetical protein
MQSAEQVLGRARAINFPLANTARGAIIGEPAWLAAVADPVVRADVAAQLEVLEEAHARTAERDARWRAADEDRATAATPDPALAEQFRREASEELARHRDARPERMEALAARTVALLETLVKAGR